MDIAGFFSEAYSKRRLADALSTSILCQDNVPFTVSGPRLGRCAASIFRRAVQVKLVSVMQGVGRGNVVVDLRARLTHFGQALLDPQRRGRQSDLRSDRLWPSLLTLSQTRC